MVQQRARLPPERVFLRLCDHADSVWYPRQAIRLQVLPRDRHADQFALRIPGASVRALWVLLVVGRALYPGSGRGK